MSNKDKNIELNTLPQPAQEFIKLIIKKMRYRRSVRRDVQAELTAHFEDELRNCTDKQQKQQKAQQIIEQFGDAKLLGILLRRAKKRCRPLWRTITARLFQTVGILILCLIIYIAWFLSGKPAVKVDYIARVNRLVRPVADESLNAMLLFDEAVAACPNLPDRNDAIWKKSYHDMNETEKETVSDIVRRCSESLQLIEQGLQKPYCWQEYKAEPDSDGSLFSILLPNLSDFRNLGRILCFRAQIQAADGQCAEAFNSLITCYRFGRMIKQGEKNLVEQLVGIAVEATAISNIRQIMQHYKIDVPLLAQFQQEFEKAYADEDFTTNMTLEKYLVYDEIQRCFTDGLGGGHLYIKQLMSLFDSETVGLPLVELLFSGEGWRILFAHPNKAQTKEQADALYDFIEETSKMSPAQLHEQSEKGIHLDEQVESMIRGNIFLNILMPAFGAVHKIDYRIKTDIHSVPVITATLRFKANTGQYPQDLTQLKQAGYINEIPIDPFSDKPLVYRKTDEGFILYSVGLDYKDDGGALGTNSEGKKTICADEGDAVFWPVQE
jgi:hypothetical protein